MYVVVLDLSSVVILTLNQSNILVNAAGCARLTEIGLSTIMRNMFSNSNDHHDQPRWTAPEVLVFGDRGSCSKESDVFSFAMVIIEVRTKLYPALPAFS